MSLRDARVEDFENRLKEVFDRIDHRLEEKYGGQYPLHPARPRHGTTGNPEQDGLFNLGAAFTAGYGSKLGRSYVIDVRMVTLSRIPDEVVEKIEKEVITMLRKELPKAFPGRTLHVARDGHGYRIYGDLSIGKVE
ncbi:MAG: hypothetical protein JXB04_00115 [Kiritimatiellae bacterium]|nr:hypothetical protein [Kiritimatiellia bacterium]